MRLVTLGGLELSGSTFGRLKPLLLLSYLALEGPRERRHLAELFWPEASDPLNSLSAALTRLRKAAPGALDADELRVWNTLTSDVDELLRQLEQSELAEALTLYRGPFLAGVTLPDWSAELEEWVYARREDIAARVQRALLKEAERVASQGDFVRAGRFAEQAYRLEAAPALEPEELTRLYHLLQAAENPAALAVKREAEELGIALALTSAEAKARLRRRLVGRERERERLARLLPGEWAWITGGPGMGKTALLRALEGTRLPGRPGLPYATLEPLTGSALEGGEGTLLARLRTLEGTWLIDNWNRVDSESQQLLTRLRGAGGRAKIIVTSREPPPFEVDALLDLGPLSPSELGAYPGLWERTRGLPALVGAALAGEPLAGAFEARLQGLPAPARALYMTLAMMDAPDVALARRALGFDAGTMAAAFEELLACGFAEASGHVLLRQVALDYLEAHPTVHAPLSLGLARTLPPLEAFPLYRRTRSLWRSEDEASVTEAYLAWAKELLRRGFPRQAAEVLADAPDSPAVGFLRARALERSGHYQEAYTLAQTLPDSYELLALESTLLRKLGKPDEARAAAEKALEGGMEARAEAFNTLGNLDNSSGEHASAIHSFQRAAALWLALGDQARRVDAINNAAIARGWLGEDVEAAFREALEAAGDNPMLRGRVLNNLGLAYERQEQSERAMACFREAAELAERSGALMTAARAWNHLGMVQHNLKRVGEASQAYRQALEFAKQANEQFLIATILGNISELTGDEQALTEAVRLLEEGGYAHIAARFRADAARRQERRKHI
jgi:tetratricopeptide (TPR) repeat protein